jgi:hypothetical protein
MPHVFGAVLIAAGVYAGTRWLVQALAHQAQEAARVAEELQRRAAGSATSPKDLGVLEYDAATQVYRPRTH